MDAPNGADLYTRIELLIAATEIGRLADLIAGTADDALQGSWRRPAERALLLSIFIPEPHLRGRSPLKTKELESER